MIGDAPVPRVARVTFDHKVRSFLHDWARDTGRLPIQEGRKSPAAIKTYLETAALADYFRVTPDPLASILRQPDFLPYLTRRLAEVEFQGFEPRFSIFEQRLYNLAAQYSTYVPFRYELNIRQTCFGDSIVPGPETDGLSPYFATRRADAFVEGFMIEQLRAEAANQSSEMAVHIANLPGHSIYESLRYAITQPIAAGTGLRCYIAQARHGFFEEPKREDPSGLQGRLDPHFGVLLVIMGDVPDEGPERVLIFDSQQNDTGMAVYRRHFIFGLDKVFPPNDINKPVSLNIEDCSLHLLMPPDIPRVWRTFDINCSFYSFAMARALVQIACTRPYMLLFDDPGKIRSAIMARMPEFCDESGRVKSTPEIRAATTALRWEMGCLALNRLAGDVSQLDTVPTPSLSDMTARSARRREGDFAM